MPALRAAPPDDTTYDAPLERLLDVGGPRDVHPFETAVVQLLGHALERRTERVVKADVGRQAHHQRRLGHVRADHAGRAHDRELVVCQKFRNRNILHWYNPVPGSCLQKKNVRQFRPYSGACRAAEPGIRPQCAPAAGHSTSRRFSRACVMVELVDIFQFVAEADAAGYGGDFQSRELPETVHQVEERRFALDRGRNGEDHLPHAAARDALASAGRSSGPRAKCPAWAK